MHDTVVMILKVLIFIWISITFNIVTGNDIRCGLKPSNCNKTGYRTVNGACNNLISPTAGMSDQPYGRLTENTFADGLQSLPTQRSGKALPSAREISSSAFPSAVIVDDAFTLALMQMGQMIGHDMSLVKDSLPGQHPTKKGCCKNFKLGILSGTDKCADIVIPKGDPFYPEEYQCIEFNRGARENFKCQKKSKHEQVNRETAYLDLSSIYGRTEEISKDLREFSEGRLKVETRNGHDFPLRNENNTATCSRVHSPKEPCYFSGDPRVNQNPQLTSLYIVFMNEHNRIAKELRKINPLWDDEKLYQEARRINIAQYQHIVYNEVLPGYLGKNHMMENQLMYPKSKGCVNDYDPTKEHSILHEFASAAWRYFHSLIVGKLELYNDRRKPSATIMLSDFIERPIVQELDSKINYNTLLRGLTIQNQAFHGKIEEPDIRGKYLMDKKGVGRDIISDDIQRGRDVGVGSYLSVRRACGLFLPKTWDDLYSYMNSDEVDALRGIYQTIEDIELYVGGSLERINSISEALMGETFHCIVSKQFHSARVGDRLFYENCEKPGFTNEQLNTIRQTSLAKVICDNSNIKRVQPRATETINAHNKVIPCYKISGINLDNWKENTESGSNEL